MTLEQACDHSLAQLRMMQRAVTRVKAADGLMSLEITYVAVAGAWSKDGANLMTRLRKALQKKIDS
ncbi:MAG: hypothetical protein JWR19_2153 [Pedosphaera sp.]|nr:hypothetical protein [Pedosphaera sp.]